VECPAARGKETETKTTAERRKAKKTAAKGAKGAMHVRRR
jgi:hypothetical protein